MAGSGSIEEPAGTFFTFVPGIVTIRKGGTALASDALHSPTDDYDEYAEFQLTDSADVGPLEAVVEVTELNHPTYRLPLTLVPAAQQTSGPLKGTTNE